MRLLSLYEVSDFFFRVYLLKKMFVSQAKILSDVGGVVLANACGPCIGQWDRCVVRGVGFFFARSLTPGFNAEYISYIYFFTKNPLKM